MYAGMIPMGWNPMILYPKSELVNLIIEGMKDERIDNAKYRIMMDMAEDDKVKKQIRFAYEDEAKHYRMFQQILYSLIGRMADIPAPRVGKIDNLKKAVEDSINGELEAVEMYRKIKALLPNVRYRDMLYEIITDEQEHATRFTYLYSLLND